MNSYKQYQYDLHMADRVIRMIPKNTESIGYFHKWLDGEWPSNHFNVSALDGRDYVLTDPSNIQYIEVNSSDKIER